MQRLLRKTLSIRARNFSTMDKYTNKKMLTPDVFKELLEEEVDLAYTHSADKNQIRLFYYLKSPNRYSSEMNYIEEQEKILEQQRIAEEEKYAEKGGNNNDTQKMKEDISPSKKGKSDNQNYFHNIMFLATVGAIIYITWQQWKIALKDIQNTKSVIPEDINKRRKNVQGSTKVSLKDIKGIDEILPEFEELLRYMKNPEDYIAMGAKIPKGILLTGPPGVGKTYLARALASESSWNFIYKSGSEFDDKYVGEGARKIKELFEQARESKPSIIFIDELDSVAGKREYDITFASQTINQLLTEMDGFSVEDDVLIIGATNLEDSLDKAVLRPGRFDKTINVPLPTRKGRKDILELYINRIKHAKGIDIDKFAKRTVGMSPADLKNLVNTAAIRAVKLKHNLTTQEDMDFAYDRILMGIKTSNKGFGFTENDIRSVAIHEIGHTLAALWNSAAMDVHKVTVLSVGGSLGSTSLVPRIEEENLTKSNVIAQLDVALGGRVAEEVYLGEDKITTGCSDDMSKATKMAYDYFSSYGLDDGSFLAFDDPKKLSEDQKHKIEKKVNSLLNERYNIVRKQFEQNRNTFLKIVDQLVEHETLSKNEILSIMNN